MSDNLDLVRCPRCQEVMSSSLWKDHGWTCVHCVYHFRISAKQRITLHLDPDSFKETQVKLVASNPLEWDDGKHAYPRMVASACGKTGLKESIVTGTGTIADRKVHVGVFDFRFLGGTLGSATGEKIARMLELAVAEPAPVVLFTMSGGARMQEGMNSLMQMAKIAVALQRFRENGGFLVNVLCDPTTGGVAASIGFVGDVILAEPGALVGFSGPRVIEESIGQELPPGFQGAENRLQQGLVDQVVHRSDLNGVLQRYISLA